MRGIIFCAIMVIGAVLNFSARTICEKKFADNIEPMMLKLKLAGLALVVAGVSLLMIFGK